MTVRILHAPMDAHTGILPCCGIHYLAKLFTGDGTAENPADITCTGGEE